MGKQFWATFGGQLAGLLAQLALVGVVAWLIWRKLFGGKTIEEQAHEVAEAAASIPRGVVSLIGSSLRGESEASYITAAEARQLAAEALARKRGQG